MTPLRIPTSGWYVLGNARVHASIAPGVTGTPDRDGFHIVDIAVADGTVECRLYFKLYRPSSDTDPHLARCLEAVRLPFAGVTPSTEPVLAETEVDYPAAPTTLEDFFSTTGFANTARAPSNGEPVAVPAGTDAAQLDTLATASARSEESCSR